MNFSFSDLREIKHVLTEIIISALFPWIPLTCRETTEPDIHNACTEIIEKLKKIADAPYLDAKQNEETI